MNRPIEYYWFLATTVIILSYNVALTALSDRGAATWNLQGSSAGTEAKWTNNVRRLITGVNGAAVLALQEAGAPPCTARPQNPLGDRGLIDPQDLKLEVIEYIWNLGTTSEPDLRYIYYTQNDGGTNRVNLALVTDSRPDHVIILRPEGDYTSVRPILGIQSNKDAYFTIHASRGGNGDGASIVNLITNYFGSRQEYDTQFMIMGDFRKNPNNLRRSLNRKHPEILDHASIYSPDVPTYKNGGITNYAVIGQYSYDLQRHIVVRSFQPTLNEPHIADHNPVQFDIQAK